MQKRGRDAGISPSPLEIFPKLTDAYKLYTSHNLPQLGYRLTAVPAGCDSGTEKKGLLKLNLSEYSIMGLGVRLASPTTLGK